MNANSFRFLTNAKIMFLQQVFTKKTNQLFVRFIFFNPLRIHKRVKN